MFVYFDNIRPIGVLLALVSTSSMVLRLIFTPWTPRTCASTLLSFLLPPSNSVYGANWRHPSLLCICVISDSITPVSIVFLPLSMPMMPHPYWYVFYLYSLHFCGYVSCLFLPWLKHCATTRKVAGSIPDGFTWIFHWRNSHGRSMFLGSTQPLTGMSTRNISWW